MNVLRSLLIGSGRNLEKRNMAWNMAGSFTYALASMLLTVAVIQMVGEDQGGIFTFAFTAFGQHMFMVAYFGMRPFHITDIGRRYSFGEYLSLRYVTCGGALAFGLAYALFKRFISPDPYSDIKAAVVFLMVCYKVIDGFADVYEAEFQRQDRLYLTGKSNTFRTLLSVFCFMGCLTATRNLVFSCAVAVGAQALGVLLFDISVIGVLPGVDWVRRGGRSFRLFRDNFLLFLSSLLDFYIFSASKYAIDNHMANRDMSVYGAIFMPTNVINLVAGFVIRPFITQLSLVWENREFSRFSGTVRKLSLIIAGLTALALGGAWILGIPVLSLLYPRVGYALASCRPALMLIILGGACNAYVNLFYYSLVIMQKQRHIFVSYGAVSVLALAASSLFVERAGILGGALSYLLLMVSLAACFGLMAVWFYRKEKERGKEVSQC